MGGNFLTMPGLPCGWTTVALGAPYPSLGVRIVTLVGVFPIVLRQGSHSAEAAEEYMEGFAPYVAIAVGGVLGANARYLVGLYFADRLGAAFPYGTLVINVTGSLVIGF